MLLSLQNSAMQQLAQHSQFASIICKRNNSPSGVQPIWLPMARWLPLLTLSGTTHAPESSFSPARCSSSSSSSSSNGQISEDHIG
jgi:hypothetical protein